MLSIAKIKELPGDMTLVQVQEMLEEQRKEKQRAKYAKNRDAQLARLRRYRETHHEEILQRQRDYHEANRDLINAKKKEARARAKKSPGGLVTPGGETFQDEKNIS